MIAAVLIAGEGGYSGRPGRPSREIDPPGALTPCAAGAPGTILPHPQAPGQPLSPGDHSRLDGDTVRDFSPQRSFAEMLLDSKQQSPIFLAPGTGFVGDNFSMRGGGWFRDG